MAQQKTDATADKLSADVKALREQIEKLSEGQREIPLLRAEVTGQDKRLSDTINRIGDVNTWLTAFGIVFAVFVAGVGIFAFVQAARRAKEEAREWLRENDQNLRRQINEMKVEADAIKAQMTTLAQEVKDEAAKHSASMGDAAQEVQTLSQRTKEVLANAVEKTGGALTPEVQKELHLAADQTRGKPEKQYTAEDWNIRAHNAYASKEWEEAARFWGKIPETPGATKSQIAQALFNKGVALGQQQRLEEAISTYDAVDLRFGTDPNLEIKVLLSQALYNKGVILGKLQRRHEAVSAYDEVDQRFGTDTHQELRVQVARALFNKGTALGQLLLSEEAISVYGEVDRRYGTDSQLELQELVARALVNKGGSLSQVSRFEEAFSTFGSVVQRFGENASPILRGVAAAALVNKGGVLAKMQRIEEAIATYDEVDRRFNSDPHPELRVQVARGLVDKGSVLRQEEAAVVYDELERRYGTDSQPEVRKLVASACGNRGWGKYHRGEDAGLLTDTDRALDGLPDADWLLGNRAFALFLTGMSRAEVMAAYERAWQVVNDPAKWEKIALTDLRAHGRTVRTDSPPVPDDLIEAVAALAKGAE